MTRSLFWWSRRTVRSRPSAVTGQRQAGSTSAAPIVKRIPPPKAPFGAFKELSIYVGGPQIYTPWVFFGTCWCRWCWWGNTWCFYQDFYCPFATRFNRLFELPPWVQLTPWYHGRFIPAGCLYQCVTFPPPDLFAPGRILRGPQPNPPGKFFGSEQPVKPTRLAISPRYAEGTAGNLRNAADFSSTFAAMSEALRIQAAGTPTNAYATAEIFQLMSAGQQSAADALTPLIGELFEVQTNEPQTLLAAMITDLQNFQDGLYGMSAQLETGSAQNPQPFAEASAAVADLAAQIRNLPSPRFANPARNLDAVANVLADAAARVTAGLTNQQAADLVLWDLYVELPSEVYHFATGMMPHIRVRLDLSDWIWYPTTIDSVEVQMEDLSTGELLNTELMGMYMPISNLSEFDLPLFVEEGTPLRLWVKAPTSLSRVVDVTAQDGLLVGPVAMLAGDANGDDVIDTNDLALVQADLGQGGNLAASVPPTDVNGDGIVDTKDLALVSGRLGFKGDDLNLSPVADLAVAALNFTPVGPDLYDVTPVVNLSLAGVAVPLEWSLYVNGALIGTDQQTTAVPFGCTNSLTCPAVPCLMQVGTNVVTGTCNAQCWCSASASIHALAQVSIPPGAQVQVVLDPRGLLTLLNRQNTISTTQLPPLLSVNLGPQPNQATLSWPLPYTGFVLESTATLAPPQWQPVIASFTTNNNRLELTLPLDQQGRYFRLYHP
ncbi:MAG TPA: dockerin type I domain-containing protein [Dongiaceae bacterium]|nr:dockerin type I domain-containing protein [Dongiaceae bacterium]